MQIAFAFNFASLGDGRSDQYNAGLILCGWGVTRTDLLAVARPMPEAPPVMAKTLPGRPDILKLVGV